MRSRIPTCGLTLLAMAASLACAKAPPPGEAANRPVALAGLKVEIVAADDGATPEDCPALAGTLLALLAGLDLPADARPVLVLAVGCESEGAELTVSAAATLDLATPGHPDETFDGAGIATCQGCGGGKSRLAVLLALGSAVRQALDLALGQARVARLPDQDLVAILSRPGAQARSILLAALEEAAMRRLEDALAPAEALLQSQDDEVALRAVGVLSRLQDAAALKALGRAALTSRPEIPFAAVRAMADIDSPETARALELVAGQATDPVLVREVAELLHEVAGEGHD